MNTLSSGNRDAIGRNQMLTPANIGMTESLITKAVKNINVSGGADSLFTVTEDAGTSYVTPIEGIPIKTTALRITDTSSIGNDEQNAVNKSYCDNNYLNKNASELTLNELTVNSSTGTPALKITTETVTGTTVPNTVFKYSNGSSTQRIMTMNCDRIHSTRPMAFSDKAIEFNTWTNGKRSNAPYPQTTLMNLVPSDITSVQLSNMERNDMLDKVCPTYQYCENRYGGSSSSGAGITYEELTTNLPTGNKDLNGISNGFTGILESSFCMTTEEPGYLYIYHFKLVVTAADDPSPDMYGFDYAAYLLTPTGFSYLRNNNLQSDVHKYGMAFNISQKSANSLLLELEYTHTVTSKTTRDLVFLFQRIRSEDQTFGTTKPSTVTFDKQLETTVSDFDFDREDYKSYCIKVPLS